MKKENDIKEKLAFCHKPKLGDIIYSLPVIREMGGGTLYLDPKSPYFPGQEYKWTKVFEDLAEYLKTLPYIEDCIIYNGQEFDVDLDDYMSTSHLTRGDRTTIVENHFKAQSVDFNKEEHLGAWLEVNDKKNHGYVIVSRSSNHRDTTVDYKHVLELFKDREVFFVGTNREHQAFVQETGVEIDRCETDTISELINVIAGADLFIGNQSFPLSIAAGLRKTRLVEESPRLPNCTFCTDEEGVL